MKPNLRVVACVLIPALAAGPVLSAPAGKVYYYSPDRRPPDSLAAILRHVEPGDDAFPEEKEAFELTAVLQEFGARLRKAGAAAALDGLLAAAFKGGRLTSASPLDVASGGPLRVSRSVSIPPDLVRDRAAFPAEWTSLLEGVAKVQTAELLITGITRQEAAVRTVVRYDLVGSGPSGTRGEDLGRWRLDWRRDPAGTWRVTEWVALDHTRSRAAAPIFSEATGTALGGNDALRGQLVAGYDTWLATLDSAFMLDSMGHHGLAVGDADGDGLDDLYVAQPSGLPNRLFRNRGDGTFEDWTEKSGLNVLDDTSQSIFADVDNDGDQDVVLIARSGPLLFVNDGKARFVRQPDAFLFKDGLRGSATSASLADYDRDGFVDLYLCTYSYFIGAAEDKSGPPAPYHDAQNGPPNVLFRNDGRGRFVDVTAEVGLDENNDRFSFASAWGDYDGDGWPDLIVANDFGRKNLYRNLGGAAGRPLKFKDVTAAAGVEDHGAGMSAAWLDYDHDGDLDIYFGNMWSAAGQRVTAHPRFLPEAPEAIRALYRRHARGNSLFRNKGDGTFEDVTLPARAEMGRWAWSSDTIDFDLDGWEDLYVVNGMFTREEEGRVEDLDSFFWRQVTARSPLERRTGTSYDDAWRAINRLLVVDGSQAPHERSVLLRNDGKGGFDEVAGAAGVDVDQDGRAFSVLDYDGDGDSDLVLLAPRSSPQLRFFRNDLPRANGSIAVRLRGTKSSRDAIGARVTVETPATRVTRVVQAGSGFISQHSKELIFGLGGQDRAARVTVAWPSGATQTFADVAANRRLVVEEGVEPFKDEALRAASVPSGPDVVPEPAPLPASTWLFQPYPAPDFTVVDLAGRRVSLSALKGQPVVLLFWSTTAPPSVAALKDLARQHAALTQAGAAVVALSLDAAGDEARVRALAAGLGFPVAMAGASVGGTYSVLNQYLFVRKENLRIPTLLLLNAAGEIVKAYRDPIAAADVAGDLGRMTAPPSERLARALPFKGTFYSMPRDRPYLQYALELVEQGHEEAALSAFERSAKQEPTAIAFYSLGSIFMKKGDPVKARAAFERALSLKADFAEANNSLGALIAQGGDVPGAIARFQAALQAKPDYADAMNNLGYAYLQTKQKARAFEMYQKALAAQPDFPQAFNNLGIYYAQEGDFVKAEEYFRRAVERQPDYGEAATNLALVLTAKRDGEGAIAVLKKLLEANPGFEMGYVTLAKVYLTIGRVREGMQALEQLLQRNPKHPMGLEMVRQLKAAGAGTR